MGGGEHVNILAEGAINSMPRDSRYMCSDCKGLNRTHICKPNSIIHMHHK